MKILYQRSIAEIAAQPLPRTEEVFEPTDEDRKKGMWAVVFEQLDENGDPDFNSTAHIIPTHGMFHQLSAQCACEPDKKVRNGQVQVIHVISQ